MTGIRTRVVALAVSAAAAIAPAAAHAVATYDDYSSDGTLGSCQYSPSQLQNDLNNAPSDVRQYDPGYLEALRRALNDRAAGACDPSASPVSDESDAAPAVPGGRGGDGSTRPVGASGSSSVVVLADIKPGGLPGWATALGFFGGLLAIAAAVTTLAFARHGTRAIGPGPESDSALSDYWWALRDRLGR